MFPEPYSLSWEDCVENYFAFERSVEEAKKEHPEWYERHKHEISIETLERNRVMILLLNELKADDEIPQLERGISHNTLRLRQPDFKRLEIHITVTKPDKIHISLWKHETLEVLPSQAVMTIKNYLQRLEKEQQNDE